MQMANENFRLIFFFYRELEPPNFINRMAAEANAFLLTLSAHHYQIMISSACNVCLYYFTWSKKQTKTKFHIIFSGGNFKYIMKWCAK